MVVYDGMASGLNCQSSFAGLTLLEQDQLC